MEIYDVTVRLREGMATYAGEEPGPVLDFHSLMSEGESAKLVQVIERELEKLAR